MPNIHQPGSLGDPQPYIAAGVVDSAVYTPRPNVMITTIMGTPTTAGTVTPFFVNTAGVLVPVPGVGAIAGAANEPNIFQLNFPIGMIFSGILLRFTDTSGGPGTVQFWATDDKR